jgi:hypothetical protein
MRPGGGGQPEQLGRPQLKTKQSKRNVIKVLICRHENVKVKNL